MHDAREIKIDRIELVTAGPEAAESGFLGWIRCRLNRSLLLDGIALRRTRDGRPSLSFPARRDGAGRQRFYLRPQDDEAREEIEYQIFVALGLAA